MHAFNPLPGRIRPALAEALLLIVILLVLLLGGCATTARNSHSAPARGPGFYLRVGQEGVAPYVRELGARDAPCLLLIHGHGEDAATDYDMILPALARQHRVLLLDLPGYGRSPSPPDSYSPEDHVRLIAEAQRRLGCSSADVVGHSMGGAIAVLLASRHPASVRRLALFDVAGILHFREYARTLVANRLASKQNALDPLRRFAHALFRFVTLPLAGTELHDLPVRKTATVKFISYDFGSALKNVRSPVFLGWGGKDRAAPMRTMEALRYWLRPTMTVLYPASGHVPMRDEPWSVARDLSRFFSDDIALSPALNRSTRARPRPLPTHSCRNQQGLVVSGEFETIHIDDCDVKLVNVRTRSLHVRKSRVEMSHVEVTNDSTGISLVDARLAWTGGRIRSPVCIETSGSELNLMAVHCEYERNGIVVRKPSRLVASASGVAGRGRLLDSLHGEYSLENTQP